MDKNDEKLTNNCINNVEENPTALESLLQISDIMTLNSKFATFIREPSKKQFTKCILDLLGTDDDYEKQASIMFDTIQENNGLISWNSFLNHLIVKLSNSHESKLLKTFPSLDFENNYQLLTHNRRQQTVNIISILTSSTPIYVFTSKHGVVGILDQHLHRQTAYNVNLNDLQIETNQKRKPMSQAWVTHTIHMPDCKKLVIGSTKRTLHFFDISAATHIEEFRLFGLPNCPTCLYYWFDKKEEDKGSILFFGDDVGNIHLLHFHQPQSLLFKKKDMEGLMKVFYMDLKQHEDYVTYSMLEKSHNGIVTCIKYSAHNRTIMSCSDSEISPLVITDLNSKLQTYTFQVTKGIKCFDFNRSLHILVTGSRDCLVRLWNPYVVSQPTATLKRHQATVLDLGILYEYCVVISYSADMVINTWDILEHSCLQTLHLNFPIVKQPGQETEQGYYQSIHLDTFKLGYILVTCKDYVTKIRFTKKTCSKWQLDSCAKPFETKLPKKCSDSSIPKDNYKGFIQLDIKNTDKQSQLMCQKPNQSESTTTKTTIALTFPKLPVISYISSKTEMEARTDFRKYIFYKMNQFGGNLTYDATKQLVQQGMPFSALKLYDVENVNVPQNMPMSQRTKKQNADNTTDLNILAKNHTIIPISSTTSKPPENQLTKLTKTSKCKRPDILPKHQKHK